jgi:NAD+ kinase
MTPFKNIGVIVKHQDERLKHTLISLLTYLDTLDIHYVLDETAAQAGYRRKDTVLRNTLASLCDLVIVIGGDGTLLGAARALVDTDTPLLGVNIGRLGFLVDVSPDTLQDQLSGVFSGEYYEEERAMLCGEIHREGKIIATSKALNDVVLHARDSVQMIEFETHIDGRLVHLQRADGIVVSTPSGSTAYALSSGGPILHPDLNAITLVPISPHTLSNRPIVVTGNSKISIQLSPQSTAHAQIAFDGQANQDFEQKDQLIIRKYAKPLRLIHPKKYDYYHILRNKLHWHAQP